MPFDPKVVVHTHALSLREGLFLEDIYNTAYKNIETAPIRDFLLKKLDLAGLAKTTLVM